MLTTTPFYRYHERVELYLHPPSGPVQACNGIALLFLKKKRTWCLLPEDCAVTAKQVGCQYNYTIICIMCTFGGFNKRK
jgi:hypothetical protein